MEILHYQFMQRALIAGLAVGFICSFISVFIVLRNLPFLGVGISHSAFGGIALGALVGANPTITATLFALAAGTGIAFLHKHGRINEDVSVGIFFSAAMASGIAFTGFIKNYQYNLFGYLFGDILSVTSRDLWLTGIIAVLGGALLIRYSAELLSIAFNEELARTSGIAVDRINYGFLALVALVVVVSIKVVGIILVSALLVIPAAAAQQLTSNYRRFILISLGVGLLSNLGGLYLSYAFNLASGAAIVLCATILFLTAFLYSNLIRS